MKPISATAPRRPSWQDPRRLRQLTAGAGMLLLGYLVLVLVALLGGPRIGASFLPLPGGGPEPTSPMAGLEPGQPSQSLPMIPGRTTATPTVIPTATPSGASTALPTSLPTATTAGATQLPPPGVVPTPTSTPTPGKPTTQIVDELHPTTPVPTQRPPVVPPTSTDPTQPPQTTDPTAPPSTTPGLPTTPPTTPDDPGKPEGLSGLLGSLLHTLGL